MNATTEDERIGWRTPCRNGCERSICFLAVALPTLVTAMSFQWLPDTVIGLAVPATLAMALLCSWLTLKWRRRFSPEQV